ncbi:MAG: sensor histidine kinase KdpD [Chloroflexi bacterium]|nr:sensor histidine kinase KdpD [Chloroflexota bacterium]
MSEEYHPNPDELLARVRDPEHEPARGKLRIFLGAARGVGKTYAMLKAAQAQADAGEQVVIGWLDTHARPELEPLAAKLPKLAPRQVQVHGAIVQELDLEQILAHHPALVLIDDLAHTNAPGARHPQRYLDVLELLEAGINVYATLNVQHIESLNDAVARITDIRERETIPDAVLEQAEITVVDLAPEELLQRLREGKVFVPDSDARNVHELYRIGNLTALRELALRRTADRVDEQMRAYMSARAIQGPWLTHERVMVCLDADALAARLVRAARQMATSLRAEWIAVHVQTPQAYRRTPQAHQALEQALALAAAQGAQVATLSGQNVVAELVRYARAQNITKIVVGKHFYPRWRQVIETPLADELIRRSGDIHVFVITAEESSADAADTRPAPRRMVWRDYLLSVAAVGGATVLGLAVRQYLDLAPTNIALFYLLAVVLSAVSWGLGPAIFTSVIAVLAFDILFVPPYGTLVVHDPQYILTFIIFLLVGILISELGSRLRAQVQAAQQREQETAALYALSQSMARDTTTRLDTALHQLDALFNAQALVLRAAPDGTLTPYPALDLSARELETAQWALAHRQTAGYGTTTFTDAERIYFPLLAAQGTLGVLSVRPKAGRLSPREQRLLEAFASQVSIALERAQLSEQAEQARLLEASERFRNALLSSLSHDLRTPLASILGSASGLLDAGAHLSEPTRRDLAETIQEEATRLNRYVANLLNMTRLESGALQPQRDWHSVEEVVGSALARVKAGGHTLKLDLEPNLPLIPFDFVLIEQVLINLLDNAYKFAPTNSPVEINAHLQNHFLQVSVADRGAMAPAAELDRMFEKFYRVSDGRRTVGIGLGLSIAKGIVEAHGGTVFAKQRVGGGMEIGFCLPLRAGEVVT